MATTDNERMPLNEPQAELERQLISAFLAGAGTDMATLVARNDEYARALIAEATRYASARLAEVEARSTYLHHLRGEP